MVATAQELGQSVAGACVLRDCVDIVPFLCGHYLRTGFAHLAFIDDGSSDGTCELLQRIAKRTPRVSVKQVHLESFEQPALMTEAVNELVAAGHSIIVPFDCDEFWDAHSATFRSVLASSTEAVVEGQWVNFVQRRSVLASTPLGLFGAIHRAPRRPDAGQETITTLPAAFCASPFRSSPLKQRVPSRRAGPTCSRRWTARGLWGETGNPTPSVSLPRRDPQAWPRPGAASGDGPQRPQHVLAIPILG